MYAVGGLRVGILLESVEHGERWSRAPAGRDPVATLERATASSRRRQRAVVRATDRGMLAKLTSCCASIAPIIPDLPLLQSEDGTSADVVREVERPPDAPRRPAAPDAMSITARSPRSITGGNAPTRERPGAGSDKRRADQAYDAAIVRRAGSCRSCLATGVRAGSPPQADDVMPRCAAPCRMACTSARSRLPRSIAEGDIFQVVLSQRYDIDPDADPFDFYRVLRSVRARTCTSSSIRHHDRGLAGADGAGARRKVQSPHAEPAVEAAMTITIAAWW